MADVMFEKVEFTNMCMVCDGSRIVVIDRKKQDWPGVTFPGGHVEQGENEFQTALREVKEETGLDILIRDNFRQCVEYFPKPHVKKQVVYFLGQALTEDVHRQEEEVSETTWADIDAAYRMVTFKNDKNLIRRAQDYLKKEAQQS